MNSPAESPELRRPLRVLPDHPCLAGHFPGRPLVPGVVLLDLAQAAARQAFGLGPLAALPNVKFLAPLLPGEDAELLLERREAARVAFQVRRAGQLLAQGTLQFAA